jgi:hypothetical protein
MYACLWMYGWWLSGRFDFIHTYIEHLLLLESKYEKSWRDLYVTKPCMHKYIHAYQHTCFYSNQNTQNHTETQIWPKHAYIHTYIATYLLLLESKYAKSYRDPNRGSKLARRISPRAGLPLRLSARSVVCDAKHKSRKNVSTFLRPLWSVMAQTDQTSEKMKSGWIQSQGL